MLQFWLALLVFFVSHSAIAKAPVRRLLVKKWGEKIYLLVYSALSVGLLAWLIVAAQQAPRIQLWGVGWLPIVIMPFACILLVAGFIVPNPLSIAPRSQGFDAQNLGLIVALTRHPILWGFALWSLSHLLANGSYPLILMFGFFVLFSLLGLVVVDKKSQRRLGFAQWQLLASHTRAILFFSPALWSGSVQLTREDKKSIFYGLLLYVVLYGLHKPLFGIDPSHLIGH